MIQSFSPGEVSYEEAHHIGVELADKVLEGKYVYVVTTHIDKEHCHNHIIFCAADYIHYNKYHACKKSYYRIRNLSDNLCREHQLSVIEPGEKRGQKHIEWQAEKTNSSWKSEIRKDINAAIRISADYSCCLEDALESIYGMVMTEDKWQEFLEINAESINFFIKGHFSMDNYLTREEFFEALMTLCDGRYSLKKVDAYVIQ